MRARAVVLSCARLSACTPARTHVRMTKIEQNLVLWFARILQYPLGFEFWQSVLRVPPQPFTET